VVTRFGKWVVTRFGKWVVTRFGKVSGKWVVTRFGKWVVTRFGKWVVTHLGEWVVSGFGKVGGNWLGSAKRRARGPRQCPSPRAANWPCFGGRLGAFGGREQMREKKDDLLVAFWWP
jgi:hypothetical protein